MGMNTSFDCSILLKSIRKAGDERSSTDSSLQIASQRFAERLEQLAVDRVVQRVVLGVPLYAEREARRVGDADRFDGAILGDALDDHAPAGLKDALPVQRIGLAPVAAEQRGEGPARGQ